MIRDISKRIVSKLNDDNREEVVFDPATILVVTQIIYQLIRIWQSCRHNKRDLKQVCHNPTFVETLVISRVVRRRMPKKPLEYRRQLVSAILKEGVAIPSDELENLLKI